MHNLSYLLGNYIYEPKKFGCRQNLLYLEALIDEIPEADAQFEEDISRTKEIFEELLKALPLPEKYGLDGINEELLFKIAVDEYRNGTYDSACEFLYYKPYVTKRIGFPHRIEYDSRTDAYITNGMSPSETENAALCYFESKGITVKTNDKN